MEIAADTKVVIEQKGQLSNGETMTHGNGIHAYERGVFGLQAISFNTVSPNRVWTVQDKYLFVMGAGCLQT
ncbi:unnamed protein product [marine sediment metagenome]|uniref:Uncharacterized protein n=1 Tax=marine sediment metagenome TaxID=412755 RepID=X1GYR3_9ZZZZ